MMQKRGFTLMEILIGVLIIGFLIVILAPILMNAPSKARDTKRISDLEALATLLKEEYLAGVDYPTDSTCIARASGGYFFDNDYGSYFAEALIPVDPRGAEHPSLTVESTTCTGEYVYIANPGGSGEYSFGIYGRLENFSNANTACSTLDSVIRSAVVNGSGDYCYVVLIR